MLCMVMLMLAMRMRMRTGGEDTGVGGGRRCKEEA